MNDALFPVTFQKIVQANKYTTFILSAKEKQFAIYTVPAVGDFIQKILQESPSSRPQTLDLIGSILSGLEAVPLQLLIHDMKESIYFCKLFLTQKTEEETQKILEIDARPSDGLSLALMYNIPIYCTEALLEKALPYQE